MRSLQRAAGFSPRGPSYGAAVVRIASGYSMVVKFIKVHVKPGRLQQYLSAQEIWNRETQPAPGFLGSFCGRCDDEPEMVNLLFWWRCREDLERWMSTEHDRIATLAKADEHYERIEVRILDAALPPEMPFADLENCL